jgi:AsmA protein
MAQKRRARRFSAIVALIAWLGLGLAAPIVISLYTSEQVGDAVVAAPSDAFTISDPIVIAASPGIRVDRGTIALVDQQGKPVPITGSMAEGGTGSGHTVRLFGGAVTLMGALQIPPGRRSATAPLADVLASGRFETLSLRRSSVTLDMLGQTPETLTDVDAEISLRRRGQVSIKGTGSLRGQRVNLDATANFAQIDRKPGEPQRLPVKVSIKSNSLDFAFDGRMLIERDGLGLLGQGELTVPSIRRAARWFGAYWPAGPGLRDMTVRGQMSVSRNALSFEKATFRMDGNESTGVVGLRIGTPRPVVFGTLAYKHIDAKPYLTETAGDPEPLSWSTLAAGVLSVPLGQHLDADLRLSSDKVVFGGLELGRSAATVSLKDGRLLADLAELKFVGGEGGGQITADFTGLLPRVTLRGKLDRIDAGPLTNALAGRPILQGQANVVADLAGGGSTLRDLMHGLAGKVTIRVQEGARIGLDLRAMAAAARTRVFVGWEPGTRGTSSFDEIDLRLVLRDGSLLTESAEARAGDSIWSATGVANVLAERVDLRLSHTVGTTPAAKAKPSAVLEFRGPLRNPAVSSAVEQDQRRPR